MEKYFRVFIAGLSVSFLGALPFGTLNITAFDISASQGVNAAVLFAIAVVLVELAIVRLTLFGSERIQFGKKFTYYIIALGILLLLYLSASSFIATGKFTQVAPSALGTFAGIKSTFVLGLLLSALNPLQIPFWLTWNKVLTAKEVLQKNNKSYNFYIMGIGLGTFVALGVFIFLGKAIFTNYQDYTIITNTLLGLLYLGFALYLVFVLIKKSLNPVKI